MKKDGSVFKRLDHLWGQMWLQIKIKGKLIRHQSRAETQRRRDAEFFLTGKLTTPLFPPRLCDFARNNSFSILAKICSRKARALKNRHLP
ncbi:MAG: hypothetical protein B9S37_06570 [Verrucomicrobiia bacterium Tous-C3TDCM]|nr:MAG: hypothetical protein B9S37_06570 [Verrucomicrobiae bacterium Tous-C3TDCM]PAZ04664.1 MAG: hypothetical protein CAK88_11020 [Verrucomicrobiae bacterium AMD-G2]